MALVLSGGGIGLAVLFRLAAGELTRKLVTSIEKTLQGGWEDGGDTTFDELAPAVRTLRSQQTELSSLQKKLDEQARQLRLITGNISEGLIVLGEAGQILTANTAAAHMLGRPEGEVWAGKRLFYLSRNQQLNECVSQALSGSQCRMETGVDGKFIEIHADPIMGEHGKVNGAVCFLLDITARKQGERMRREFTANVSHELKTPLTTISGFAELLGAGEVGQGDVVNIGGRIHRESIRLLDMITDILKLSELDEFEGLSKMRPVELLDICREQAALLEPMAAEHEVELRVTGQPSVIIGSRTLIIQLIHNLLENAIRYNRRGGSVTASVTPGDEAVLLKVADTGIGMHHTHHSRVFERFYRVDASRSKATGGTGLGLAIVKHVAEHHGATINLISTPDIGTTITVSFTISP